MHSLPPQHAAAACKRTWGINAHTGMCDAPSMWWVAGGCHRLVSHPSSHWGWHWHDSQRINALHMAATTRSLLLFHPGVWGTAASLLLDAGQDEVAEYCLPMPAPMSTRRLSLVMPQCFDMHSRTLCMPEHASVPYRPSMPSPPPSLFCTKRERHHNMWPTSECC